MFFNITPHPINNRNIQRGILHGKGSIRYEDDGTILEGNFYNGSLNGKALLFDNNENLIFVGLYQAGLPHGPFWIYSSYGKTFIFVHFERGKLVNDDVVLVMEKNVHFGLKGKLVNSTFLQDVVKVRIAAIGEYNCLQVIKTMELLEEVNVGILDN